ncbi:MAG TPA: CYTH and CHAD domain-containing protein [Acidimicrobiia bacterium]|nr:CYTH and CHAD domain-containing protein [Acidimicrobiia bacterium]
MSSRQSLSSPPGFQLPPLGRLVDGIDAVEGEPAVVELTYHDTPDLRLARAGATLLYRGDDGWVVTLGRGGADDPGRPKHEHRFDGEAGNPPAAALELVRALVRTSKVGPVARLRTRRRPVELHDRSGKTLGQVLDDEVTVLAGGRVAARFREVELEVDDAAPEGLVDALHTRLRAAGAGPPDPSPQIVRALGWRALEPPDVAAVHRLGPSPPAADVIRNALAASVARLVAHDPGVRLGDDPEDVHQARVATRRLRSDLRTFRDLLDADWAQSLRRDLKGIAHELGAVRDTEVLLDRLRAHAERLPPADQAPAKKIVQRLLQRWDEARAELRDALESARYAELLDRLVEAAQEPALLPDADAPATDLLPPLVREPWGRLRATVDELPEDPPDAQLHEVRIEAKRCRYAAEAVAPAIGKRARAFAKAIADLQDVLGEHQDAVVAEAWLREVASAAIGREVFVAGQLASLERLEIDRTRKAWGEVWQAASKKKLRQWL